MSTTKTDNQAGKRYWRSLEEYADSPAFQAKLSAEFPGYDPDQLLTLSRRGFLKLGSAAMALAGLTLSGCRRFPQEKLAPFANRPDGRIPGETQYFATMSEFGGVATGLLVESFDGRPIKIEGNPEHPYSRGATTAFQQADLLDMYDPERSRAPRVRAERGHALSTWEAFEGFVAQEILADPQAPGLAILAEPSSSPTLARLRAAMRERFPNARWYEYEPLHRRNEVRGGELAFGQAVRPVYDLSSARVIVAFESDFLANHPAALKLSREWARGRRVVDPSTRPEMNRLYVAESAPTCTGSVADERLAIKSRDIASVVAAVADAVGVEGLSFTLPPEAKPFVDALVADLQASRGHSAVLVGPSQSPEVHALVWRINIALGNVGESVAAIAEPTGEGVEGIDALASAIDTGSVQTLVILGGNPAFDAPADLGFAELLARVPASVHLSLYFNETSAASTWHLPRAHYLESWGDGRAWDGTISIQQPLILPLFNGRTPAELLALLLGERERYAYDLVRTTMRGLLGEASFELRWREALHEGLIEGTEFPLVTDLTPNPSAGAGAEERSAAEGFEVTFQPSPNLHDGRFANNGWLQELPGPLTKLTWMNAAWMNVADARELGVVDGSLVRVRLGGAEAVLPVYRMPGQARGSIALPVGYGRTHAGSVGGQINEDGTVETVGVNVYPLRTSLSMFIAAGAEVAPTGEQIELPLTQEHHLVDWVGEQGLKKRAGGSGDSGYVVKEATLEEFVANPDFVREGAHGDYHLQMFDPPMVTEPAYPGAPVAFNEPHAWGMTVDMNSCIGCSACVVACQAENNIPVVGPRGVRMSREMHWLRVDRYFKTNPTADPEGERPDVVFMPMFCVHCENAPCESVCPVAATVHDTEGINTMVYNRCIGTRYCSNNCPYKVRRFNYFDWHSKPVRADWAKPWLGMPDSEQRVEIDAVKQMMFNPDVTVRMRGVMEKCTYCVQRIQRAKIDAKAAWQRGERSRPIVEDDEIMTACQQVCPTEALVFGNLNDPNSRVSRLQRNPRTYSVLEDLNTRPRTKHMAKIRNLAPGAH